MKITRITIELIVFSTVCSGCLHKLNPYDHTTIVFQNFSDVDLCVISESSDTTTLDTPKDTILSYGGFYQQKYHVYAHKDNTSALRRPSMDLVVDTYETYFYYHSFLIVFIVKGVYSKRELAALEETLVTKPYRYPYIARYDVTLDDLIGLDWKIRFPPGPEMASVHMWPSYEELVARYGDP